MKSLPVSLGRWLVAGIILVSQSSAQERSIRFYGNGYQSPGTDRVKIPLNVSTPVNVSDDFTIECWLKCDAADNKGNVFATDHGDGWITGNVFIDRDVYGNADPGDFGFSIGSGQGLPGQTRVIAFGINRKGMGITLQGKTQIADNKWHHMALTRNGSSGEIRLYIDGKLDAEGRGPAGAVNYLPGRSSSYPDSDPYLVIGAEKHDGGGAYPAFNGFLDELRISNSIRYENEFSPQLSPFKADESTSALYHFNEGSGEMAKDEAAGENSTTHGILKIGGDPVGPVWKEDSPFSSTTAPGFRDFRAQKNNRSIQLSWKSAATPASAFFIQRSRDGKTFSNIEKINKQPGCSTCEYRYSDSHPFEGKNYYRISYAVAGKDIFSPSLLVSNTAKVNPYRINQEGNNLVLRNSSAIESLVIWNSEGKRVAEKKMISQGTTRVALGQARGLAFVHITLDDGTRFTEKLMLR